VVLQHVGRRGLVIHNPAIGKQKVSWQEAGKHFTGVAIELTPTERFDPLDEIQKLPFLPFGKVVRVLQEGSFNYFAYRYCCNYLLCRCLFILRSS
jgi:ATP-binding cassette subfamily B protein RaxB